MSLGAHLVERAAVDRNHLTYDYWRYEGRDWRAYEMMYLRMTPVPPVLELGCGLGFFLECCRHHDVWAVGAELSEEGVSACASRGLSVVRADITLPLPFRNDAFRSALAHHVLEHIPIAKERQVLHELHRVLRPGGFLLVVSPNVYHPNAAEDPDHINLFAPRQLRRELLAAGFNKVSLSTNYWRPFWEPALRLGRISGLVSGVLWKIAPIDRLAGSASALAYKA